MSRVIHFEIQADDINRAKNFYEKTFGWKIKKIMNEAEGGMMDYWGLETGPEGSPGINGGMYKRPKDNPIFTYDCTVMVNDIDKAAKDVMENGGKITKDKSEIPGVGWFVAALDTEGNKLGIMQPTEWEPK